MTKENNKIMKNKKGDCIMTGKELVEKLQGGIINSLNETGVTNGDGKKNVPG